MALSSEILGLIEAELRHAKAAGELEPTAMVLATMDGEGSLSTRTVLLKSLDVDGLVFFTNTLSIKGRELRKMPFAAVTLFWKMTICQVHASGRVSLVSDEEADAYFSTRDRASQIGAWASRQSEPLASREVLDARVREFEEKFAGVEVPRPPHWSGYRLSPSVVEFWHGRPHRLHDRIRYTLEDNAWTAQRLYP